MDLVGNLLLGFETSLTSANLFYCFLGAVVGTLIGVLPGVGPTATIAMLLPLTFTLPPASALIMLGGIYYGAQYGGSITGSITAILINLPGEATSAITAIDGYQMARQGRAGPALAISAIGSFFAGTVGTLIVALFAIPLTAVALNFGAPEYFSLMLLGLVCSVTLAHGALVKALAMVVLGLAFGTIGTDVYTGAQRFTLGFLQLADGVDIVALAVGVFGVAEILRNLEADQERAVRVSPVTSLVPSQADVRASVGPILRGTLMGSLLGILPGGGALLSAFGSYALEKKISKTPERFGQGAIEGVAGPESANNAGAQTSFIPMLTLGLPANPVMALMLGAMIIQGIQPGPNVAIQRPELFWGIITSMWFGNLFLLLLNLPLVGIWVALLRIPYKALFPAVIAFSTIGTYAVHSNAFDVYSIVVFGLLGYLLIKLGCEPAPFLLGFVLGPALEEQLRRAMILSDGSLGIFVALALPAIARRREKVFIED
jgi:putative tricarboxylic transport membrane protein